MSLTCNITSRNRYLAYERSGTCLIHLPELIQFLTSACTRHRRAPVLPVQFQLDTRTGTGHKSAIDVTICDLHTLGSKVSLPALLASKLTLSWEVLIKTTKCSKTRHGVTGSFLNDGPIYIAGGIITSGIINLMPNHPMPSKYWYTWRKDISIFRIQLYSHTTKRKQVIVVWVHLYFRSRSSLSPEQAIQL
jgi:hypothetical protein